MTALLDVTGLSVRTDAGRTIVRGLDLRLGRGETVGIVGESGSGKSLSMRAVAGLLPQGLTAGGRVALDGTERTEAERRAVLGRRLTMMFQDPFTMLNPLMRVGAQVAEGMRDASKSAVAARLAEVGIPDASVARRYPFELSGGLRQRVGLAAALAGDPDILIADEPSTALDVTTQAEIVTLLRRTGQGRGMGLVIITHDLRLAFSICDRVLVLYAGGLVEVAPTAALRAMPRHPYTQGLLLSEPPIDRKVARMHTIPGGVPEPDDVAGQCSFADRCDWATDACRTTDPPLEIVAPDHRSACLRQDEIADDMATRRTAHLDGDTARAAPDDIPDALVRIDGLAKSFGTARVLRDIDLVVPRGQCVGLVGESGSGKTTLARCLVGLETADAGRIEIEGNAALDPARASGADLAAFRRKVQFVFQDPYATLNPRHTIRKCLAEILRANHAPRPYDARMTALLDQVGLPAAYLDRRPAQLSGGERQRIAIARALALSPSLLICDEPVSALDVSVQAQVLNLLTRLVRDEGLSCLFVTHDLSVVRQIADRICVLQKGVIVESGPTERVMRDPQHAYTRALLAAVPGADQASGAQ